MQTNPTSNRIHPLMAGAAVSVILVSLLGIAAITGVLPTSHATAGAPAAVQTTPMTAQMLATAPVPAPTQPVLHQVATAPAVHNEGTKHKTVVHHHQVQHAQAQAQPAQQFSQAPAYQQPPLPPYQQPAPVAQNSPVGIGVGAVVGGLLGNQIGGGKGKTLATIAGAVGGGYVGNEIAKRNP
ncbi:glycine zipper 2TM domain-containing protein [Polaromonas naphthalenivorans]|uniref:17 kDa surface antigen n=1 Tax=Polaromonas naphthalenivorans (strain CJ2) TaxID=365044 RepID=A1VWI1_POLNA|nr:17 kDa surface antigen [Polaromonas naphthalenivorans CJ2]